jgi:hypothetical protein
MPENEQQLTTYVFTGPVTDCRIPASSYLCYAKNLLAQSIAETQAIADTSEATIQEAKRDGNIP